MNKEVDEIKYKRCTAIVYKGKKIFKNGVQCKRKQLSDRCWQHPRAGQPRGGSDDARCFRFESNRGSYYNINDIV